jgi:UDP-2,3-diacylglucosamine pyrophosphatase LpxH
MEVQKLLIRGFLHMTANVDQIICAHSHQQRELNKQIFQAKVKSFQINCGSLQEMLIHETKLQIKDENKNFKASGICV